MFKLSADVLRAAGGQVRCGKCGEVFNALAHLAEDSSAFVTGESAFDLESRADSILESRPAPPPAQAQAQTPPDGFEDFEPQGVEIARLQILDWSGDELTNAPGAGSADPAAAELGETSMEFTLPPGELDRIFVESKTAKRPTTPPTAASKPPPEAEPAEDLDALLDVEILSDNRAAAAAGFEVSDVVRREMLQGLEPPLQPLAPPPQVDRSLFIWLTAAVAFALLLAGQLVHQNREWLSAHTAFGAPLRGLYSTFGAAIPQPANLTDYQLRQWGVTGDPAADGTLRVRASILNTAQQREPFPLLRVTLANRFGSSIGTRDFEPAEYMGKSVTRLLAPGERVDATMDILDPGKSAEGFEIDVCLRSAEKKISCANDATPQTKR